MKSPVSVSCLIALWHLRQTSRSVSGVVSINCSNCVLFAALRPPSSLLVSTIATVYMYCTASPLPIFVHFSQLSTRLHASSLASASSTTSPTPWSTCTGYQSANVSNSSCAHWLASVSAAQRRPTWLTCVSLCRWCLHGRTYLCSAIHYDLVVPRTRLARYGLRVVSPSRVQRPGTVCRLMFATCLYPLPVSSINSRLNCSSDHGTFVIVYYKRGRKLTLIHCIVLYCYIVIRNFHFLESIENIENIINIKIWYFWYFRYFDIFKNIMIFSNLGYRGLISCTFWPVAHGAVLLSHEM